MHAPTERENIWEQKALREILQPFLLSLVAGLASGLGEFIVLAFGEVEDHILGFLMGFAGGRNAHNLVHEAFRRGLGTHDPN